MKAYQPFNYPLTQQQIAEYQRLGDVLKTRGSSRTPAVPRDLTATPGALLVTLSWQAPVVADDGTGWRVYMDTENNLVKQISDRNTLTCDVPVEDGLTHNFFVSSVNGLKKESRKVQIQAKPEGFSTSTHLNLQGSVMPNQAIIITIAFTDTTISLSWASQSVKRSDGSILTLQAGTKNYTGLSVTTSYYIYGRINAKTGVMTFTNTDPPSTTPDATRALNAGLDGGIPVPPMKVTTAGGGGSGGGTGGGGDVCPEESEAVEMEDGRRACGLAGIGEKILGYSFKHAQDVYRKIVGKAILPNAAWRIVDGRRVTPCEPVYKDGWTPAFRVPGSTFDELNSNKVLLTVESDEYDESNYYLYGPHGERLLIHNNQMALPC